MTLSAYAIQPSSFPEIYETHLVGPLFRPFAEKLLDETALVPGNHVLDVACGTGIVARLARQRLGDSGRVAGVDSNPGMLSVARRVAPDIEWREGKATELPLRDGESFDIVTCHQGLQFFPDKPAAVEQMRRALKPGGSIAIATWANDSEMPFLAGLRRIAEEHLGPIHDNRYGFGDPAAMESLLRGAAFHDIRVWSVHCELFFPGSTFLWLNATAFIGMSAAGKELDEEKRNQVLGAILEKSTAAAKDFQREDGLAFEMRSLFATGVCR
jgi:SAM-dependent methyltransferase